jgi:hypothetical protein
MDDDHSTAWDDDRAEHRNPTDAFNRRHLLGAAASGFALAASGLLLPERLIEEAAAREGANGGAMGGRHGKDRRGGHHRHTHGDHRDKKGKEGQAPRAIIRGIRWGVYSPSGSYNVELWDRGDGWSGFSLVESQRWTGANFVELRTNRDILGALWINGRYYLQAFNGIGTPTVTLGYGGTIDSSGWKNGTTVLESYELRESKLAPPMDVDGIHFQVERLVDDDDFKRFSLSLS